MKQSLPSTAVLHSTSIRTNSDLSGQSTRTRIIKTAAPLFLKNGYRTTSVDQLSNYLGISKKTFYKIFRSKHELIIATQSEIYDLMMKVANEVERKSIDCIEYSYRLKYELDRRFGFYQQLLNFSELSDSYNKTSKEIQATYLRVAEDACMKGMRMSNNDGFLNKEIDPSLASFSFSRGYINFLVNTEYEKAEYDKVFELWFYMFLKGLLNFEGAILLNSRIKNRTDTIYHNAREI